MYKPYPTRHQTNEPIVYIGNTSACDGPELWTYAHEHQHFRDRGVHRSGVGLRIGYSDDNFNLSLHAGSPYYSHYGHSLHRRYVCEPVVYSPLYGSVYDIRWRYPRTSYSSAYPNENWGTASTEVVYVGATSVAPTYEHPAPAPQQQVPQASNIPEDIQSAAASLRNGHTGQAIDTLRNYVALNDTDTLASRALAVALLRNGDTASGVALIGLVYERDPSLASKPIDGQFWLGNDRALRELVRDVSGYANQAGTPSGWLTLAVLMQAEGRDYHARQMLERAERAGLQTRVLGPMLQATGSRRVVGRGLQ